MLVDKLYKIGKMKVHIFVTYRHCFVQEETFVVVVTGL